MGERSWIKSAQNSHCAEIPGSEGLPTRLCDVILCDFIHDFATQGNSNTKYKGFN